MALPPIRKKNPLAIFGAGASYQNKKAPNFIDQRNQGLASQYTQQGIQDQAGVQNQLMQNKSFARANTNDQQNTISNILGLMKKGGASTNMVQKATASNPISTVNVGTQPADLNSLDLGGLQDEYTRYMYRSQSGNLNEDDAVRLGQIQRRIQQETLNSANQPSAQGDQAIQDLQAQRDAEAERLSGQSSSELDAYRRQVQANLNKQIMDLESSGRKTSEAAAGAMSFSGFGRGTANVEQQTEIERQKQESINAARAAADMEIMREQQRLAGASAETLQGYDQQIAGMRGQAAQIQQQLAANAQKINQQQTETFTSTLNDMVAKQQAGIGLDINDEKAFSNIVSLARNPDGSVNEDVLASLPEQYRAIIKAGVANTTVSGPKRNLKRERIGGSNKAPTYGFVDLDTGEIIGNAQANAMGYGSGGGGGGGASGGGGVGAMDTEQQDFIDRLKRIQDASNSSLVRSTGLYNPDIQADLDYLKANLTFEKISEMKKNGVKLGALSDADMKTLGNAAASITPGMSKAAITKETNRLITKLGGSTQAPTTTPVATPTAPAGNTTKTQAPANTKTNTTTTNTKSGVSKNKFKKLLAK